MMESLPLDGDVLILAGGRANVTPARLVAFVRRAQTVLGPRFDDYDRRFECVHADDARALFLVPRGHWAELGDELDIEAREADALRRAHEQQLLRVGSNRGRREEFETAMEIREVVVVSR